ncbi:MAG: tyrosine-protein phosphatase [Candidatus Wallbacteria bacterium]|nr:tyrosine-protein phosphatase [Candidatus Wallbacteria bacterium]
MAAKPIRLLAAGLCLLGAVTLRAGPPADADARRFKDLQKMAAARPDYSTETGQRLLDLIEPIWNKPEFRHRVAHVLNANGGALDAIMNRVFLEEDRKAGLDLPNFAVVDDKVVRGGQPNAAGFKKLKELGVKTVVNLRLEDNSEEAAVRSLGMQPVWLPVPDTDAPGYGQMNELLRLLHAPETGKVYVHCAAGANRTGTMVSLWRVECGWTAEKALAEARKFGFREDLLAVDREAALVRGFVRRRLPD